MIQDVLNFIEQNHYSRQTDFPCLFDQFQRFQSQKPLRGLHILHATPLFKNVVPKLLPLLASEAQLTLSCPANLSPDMETVTFLRKLGVPFIPHLQLDLQTPIDMVLDCTGSFANLKSLKYGSVELTRSGEDYYSHSSHVCISVDQSEIKLIEDRLGTSDGLVRALKKLGYELKNKKVLLFGFGKVGYGVYQRLTEEGAQTTIVDVKPSQQEEPPILLAQNKSLVEEAAATCDFIITATGVKNLIESQYNAEVFLSSPAVKVNIGAEDEFGPSFGKSDVLNQKAPVNFILSEPTQLKFLDATFALHNECLLALKTQSFKSGIHSPPKEMEQRYLKISRKAGIKI